jgi:hypothetical protein
MSDDRNFDDLAEQCQNPQCSSPLKGLRHRKTELCEAAAQPPVELGTCFYKSTEHIRNTHGPNYPCIVWVLERLGKYTPAQPPTAASIAEADLTAAREELANVLEDWNALVKASGSRTNGGAVGHVAAIVRDLVAARKEIERLTNKLELTEEIK